VFAGMNYLSSVRIKVCGTSTLLGRLPIRGIGLGCWVGLAVCLRPISIMGEQLSYSGSCRIREMYTGKNRRQMQWAPSDVK
jgi:hypothetical protein